MPMLRKVKFYVEDCNNWSEISLIGGRNCYNCAKRDGYPDRGQPDKRCSNFDVQIMTIHFEKANA